jgi:hypothetical protein
LTLYLNKLDTVFSTGKVIDLEYENFESQKVSSQIFMGVGGWGWDGMNDYRGCHIIDRGFEIKLFEILVFILIGSYFEK